MVVDHEENFSEIEYLSKFPLSQFTHDVSEMRKDCLRVEKALASQTTNEYDRVTVKLGDLPARLRKDLSWIEQQTIELFK
jgi:hypothetical protein